MRRILLGVGNLPGAQRLIVSTPAARRVARRFVAGERTDDAIQVVRELNKAGLRGILDLLGEGVASDSEAEAATAKYLETIAEARDAGLNATISLKLTQLGLVEDGAKCRVRLERIAAKAGDAGVGLEVDMEQSEYVAAIIDICLAAKVQRPPRVAIQAYLHRTPDDLRRLTQAGAAVRLVKGAYLESGNSALQGLEPIRDRYKELATYLLEHGPDPAFATHDEAMIDHISREAERLGVQRRRIEVQMLFGIRRDRQLSLAREGFRVGVYVPYGSSWYPYFMRRLAERPANLAFFFRSLWGA